MTARARPLVVGLVLCALLAACSGATQPEPTVDPGPDVTEAPAPDAPVYPLTGLPAEDDAALERPVLALKIDNLAPARPQAGIEAADVVFVELVEGATRFIALFHSTDPGVAGPVRSGRYVDADVLPPFAPVFGISGAAADVLDTLRNSGLHLVVEGQEGGDAFFREPSRRRPHDVLARVADLWAAGAELGAATQPWPYAAETPDGGTAVEGVDVAYPRSGSSGWDWDAATSAWLRTQDGDVHETMDGERLTAQTVIVAVMPATGLSTRPIDVVGEGEAIVLRDGQQFRARWRKPDKWTHFAWVTPEGEPLPLAPGRTWIELVPTSGQVTVRGDSL